MKFGYFRAEAMHIYYGKKLFHLVLPHSDDEWLSYLAMLRGVALHGILNYLTYLEVATYVETEAWEGGAQKDVFWLEMYSGTPEYLLKKRENGEDTTCRNEHRVGDDNTDWTDYAGAKRTFLNTLKLGFEHSLWERKRRMVPVKRLAMALAVLAPWCTQANKYVEVEWDTTPADC